MSIDPSAPPTAVVARWQDALNGRDHAEVLALSDGGIEILGPRGTAVGIDVLRRWLEGTSVQLRPFRTFARGARVVVAQRGIWTDPTSGEIIGRSDVASAFEVKDGRVSRYARFDTLEEALAHADLKVSDELGSPWAAPSS
jgi:hypothetical protein